MSSQMNDSNNKSFQLVCPSINELSTIINEVICKECNLVFCNESRFRMHDLKVHKKMNLSKKENIHYHCPIENCIYAIGKQKYFALHKYLKQVSFIIHIY